MASTLMPPIVDFIRYQCIIALLLIYLFEEEPLGVSPGFKRHFLKTPADSVAVLVD